MYPQFKNGKWTFIYHDSVLKKNVRLPQSEVPSHIQSREDADEFCRLKESEFEMARYRMKRRNEWENKFYDFSELLEIHTAERMEAARNSWKNEIYYLKSYAFHFFLNEKQCNNLNNWSLYFEEFKDWLKTVRPLKAKSGQTCLSYATMNHCIKSLNAFLGVMKRKGKMSEKEKCSSFPSKLLRQKDVKNVIPESHITLIRNQMALTHPDEADLFYLLAHTGVRESEGLGLSFDCVIQGEPPNEEFKSALSNSGIRAVGYIILESQVNNAHKIRDSSGRVPRKPLKCKPSISSKYNRTIPIMDKELFNMLVGRWEKQRSLSESKTFGDNLKDYLLFDGVNKNTLYNSLTKACETLKINHYSPHDTRHTFSTNFVGRTLGNFFLCRVVLGHTRLEQTLRYVHIFEKIQNDNQSKVQLKKGLTRID